MLIDELQALAYVHVDGAWSIPDSIMTRIWHQMVDDGTYKAVFPSGSVKSLKDFFELVKNPKNCVMTQWIGIDCVFLGWINNMTATSACAHFCCFSAIWGTRTEEALKRALRYWFSFHRDNGEPLFYTLIGMISAENKRAIALAKKCGVTDLGVVPNHNMDVYLGHPVGTYLCFIERDQVEKWAV